MAESRFWEGFVLGGLAGLGAGLLAGLFLAPQAGAETRRTVAEKGRELKEAAGQAYRSVAAQVGEAAAAVREAVGRGREVAVEVTSELTEKAEEQLG